MRLESDTTRLQALQPFHLQDRYRPLLYVFAFLLPQPKPLTAEFPQSSFLLLPSPALESCEHSSDSLPVLLSELNS
jgi:hypothetical protein